MIVILVIGILVDALVFGTLDRAIRRRWGLLDPASEPRLGGPRRCSGRRGPPGQEPQSRLSAATNPTTAAPPATRSTPNRERLGRWRNARAVPTASAPSASADARTHPGPEGRLGRGR